MQLLIVNGIILRGGIISLDGKQKILKERSSDEPIDLGRGLALEVLEAGGQKILKEIKKQI